MEIEGIGNYYGSLNVKEIDGLFYWGIENYDGYTWVEIPKSLYNEIIDYEKEWQADQDRFKTFEEDFWK
jgi:hypothetical protein